MDDDAESDEEESSEEATPASPEPTTAFVRGDASARRFHAHVMRTAGDWGEWQPDDPVRQLLKSAIESAQHAVC